MKVKIKSFNGDLPDYLTVGKEYDFEKWGDDGFGVIQDDIGLGLMINTEDCDFLNGVSWEVVE